MEKIRHMGACRIAMLMLIAAGRALAQPAPAAGPALRILAPPPMQWDHAMQSFRPALQQTATDFANLTGGVAFGMSAPKVNALLPDPYPGISWNRLPVANEYPGDVRYLGVPMVSAGSLRMDVTACTGSGSYVALLFSQDGLFRLSYRLLTDKLCTDTHNAAQEIFARYVTMGQTVALSTRYRTGKTEVVDITDSTAGYLIPTRWRQGGY